MSNIIFYCRQKVCAQELSLYYFTITIDPCIPTWFLRYLCSSSSSSSSSCNKYEHFLIATTHLCYDLDRVINQPTPTTTTTTTATTTKQEQQQQRQQ